MVKYTTSQVNLLENLKNLKAKQDELMRQFEYTVAAKRKELKMPVMEAIAAAQEAGISQRAIALKGLGYADVGSLKQYLEPGINGGSSRAFTFAPPAASAYEVTEIRQDDPTYAALTVETTAGTLAHELTYTVYEPLNQYVYRKASGHEKYYQVTPEQAAVIDTAALAYLQNKYKVEFTQD